MKKAKSIEAQKKLLAFTLHVLSAVFHCDEKEESSFSLGKENIDWLLTVNRYAVLSFWTLKISPV